MQQESPRLNKLQFLRFKKIEKALKEEFKKRDSIHIEIPALARAKISFQFNPIAGYGKCEELALLIESTYFNLPVTERSSIKGLEPIYIPLNTSYKNQKINISGISKALSAVQVWNDSDMLLLEDKPLEKIIGFNSTMQPDNYDAIKCFVTIYRL